MAAKKPKERERYYLLPGQGGKNFHLKQRRQIIWAIAAALLFSALLTLLLWWLAKPQL